MKYSCSFPNCDYTCSHKSKIDEHHVTPLEVDKNSKLTIPLCKNHHSLIYHPKAKYGQHSINTKESIQILGVYKSTGGNTVHYEDYSGIKYFYIINTKQIIEDS